MEPHFVVHVDKLVDTGMIDTTKPFSLYANCSITYDGRAYSTLENGNYLIIYKQDGSLIIHGSDLCKPRNYQPCGSIVSVLGNVITSVNRKETIKIFVNEVLNYTPLLNWSSSKIQISRTEKELVDKIYDNWPIYFQGEFSWIKKEFATELGPIDIAGMAVSNRLYIIEVKRKKASISHITQLKRYVESCGDDYNNIVGILAAPEIGAGAMKYLEKSGFKWLEVKFD